MLDAHMPDTLTFQFGDTQIGPREIMIGVSLLVLLLALFLGQRYWRWKLRKWAEGEGVQLVSFRWARFYEGPSAWMRSRNQHLFKAVVRDRDGQERSCWIMFGTFWGFTWGEPVTHVEWTDDD
jgi:hypothetical protein